MKTAYFVMLFVLGLTQMLFGQSIYEIEGRIVNNETNEPIPFTNIYNTSLKKGTISNTDGFFRVSVRGITDTVVISFIGFKEQRIILKEDTGFYLINLEVNVLHLGEVIVTPKDNSYLFNLIQECRKTTSTIEKKSKAYYELKSFKNDKQIELVEGYYNLDIKGYKLIDLHLKAGRVALQPYKNRIFASLESSRALIMLNIFNKDDYFPTNPLALSKIKLKKSYYLYLDNKYVNNATDSVYVIDYKPKDTTGLFFEGKIWINKTKNHILKISMNCKGTLTHPFLPLFLSDTISNVSFNITQSFKTVDNQVIFNHIDFVYKIDYKSRIGKAEEQSYSIKTNAILYAYDFDNTFFLPHFDFNDKATGDYRKISALPYNDFFWAYNDEYRLKDSINSNERFFSDSIAITNKTLFKPNTFSKQGLFEHPYVEWSKNRIKFREILPDSSNHNTIMSFKSEQYNLAVKIYLDIDTYKDSTHIVTSTIFDPYESYYYLPMDNQTHCFNNIYFDLCEIERRTLEEKLKTEKNNILRVSEIYNHFSANFEIQKAKYLNAVERGTNEREMLKYNNYVFEKLGIDNIELFQPYKSEK